MRRANTNHRVLVTQLNLDRAASDDVVVAATVQRWGDTAAQHLPGGFASVEEPDGRSGAVRLIHGFAGGLMAGPGCRFQKHRRAAAVLTPPKNRVRWERFLLQNTVPNGEVRSDMNDKTLEDSIWSTPRLELISDSGRIAGAIAPGTDEGSSSAASGAD